MKNTTGLATAVAIALFSISIPKIHAGAPSTLDCIDAGFDLYQLGGQFELPSIVVGPPAGQFLGVPVVGMPLGTFDFGDGNGLVSVGTADTIVRRTTAVFEDNPQSVPIEILAMQLQSAGPVLLPGQSSPRDVFISLSSTPSDGSYNSIEFFGNPFGSVAGAYQTLFNIHYEARFDSPIGPLVDLDPTGPESVSLLSDFSAAWSHFPQEGDGFGNGTDRVIPGVNSLLSGFDQSGDFFLSQDNALVMSDFFGNAGEPPTQLTFTMADANPGDQPDVPVLPDSGGGNGEPFVFQDVTGDGAWFDPPLTNAYAFETTDGLSNFVTIGLPPAAIVPDTDMSFLITSADGAAVVVSGGFHTFGSPVSEFTISGIDPAVDGGDPLAFPVFLLFDQSTVSFTMTPVPEPSTLLLALASVIAIGIARR